MMPIRTSDPMRTKNATRPSRPVSVKTLGYIASTKCPPVMPVPQIGNFCHISNDCCHERSRSDVEESILKVPTRICPSSCAWVNVYKTRSFTWCGAHKGAVRVPRSTMAIRIGFRGARNPMTLRVTTPAAKNEARDPVAMSPMAPAARRSRSGSRMVTASFVNNSPDTIASMKTRYPPRVLGSPSSFWCLSLLVCFLSWNGIGQEQDTIAQLKQRFDQLEEKSKWSEAIALAEKIVALTKEKHGEQHPETVDAMHSLARMLNNNDDHPRAEQLWQTTLALEEQLFGKDSPQAARSLRTLGNLTWSRGEYEKAEELLQR